MALKGNISTTLSYHSEIEGVKTVYMSATIPENGMTTQTKKIMDKEVYEANKEQCRTDMKAFDRMVEEVEDRDAMDMTGEKSV